MSSFYGALLGFNNLQMHSYNLVYIVCLCQKYLVHLSKWRVQLGFWEAVFFPVPEEVVCSFFNIVFDIFWAKYKFGLCIKTWRREFGFLRLSFTSQGESHSVPDRIFFATLLLILSHFELSRIELPKLTSSILMEIVTIIVALVDQFYFYMHQPIKPWLFEKTIF